MPTQSLPPREYQGRDAERSKKMDVFNQAYGERQREFDRFLAKPLPPTDVNFKEKLDDEPISNMEELIEKHKRERELEMSQIPNIMYNAQSTQQLPQPHQPFQEKIKIQESSDNIPNLLNKEIIHIPLDNIPHTHTQNTGMTLQQPNKKVSWSNNLTENDQESISTLKIKYEELEKKYNDLNNKVQRLFEIQNGENKEQTTEISE